MKTMRIFILLSISFLLVLPCIACQSVTPFEKAVICGVVNQDGSPKETADSFPPDVKTIYCSIKLRTLSNSSDVKGDWYIVSSQQANLKQYYLGGETAKAETEYIVFAFERADQPLPTGDYEIRLSYANQQHLTVPFKIQGGATASTAKLSEAVICSSIDTSTNKPLDKMDLIPNDAGAVFCSVKVTGAGFATVIKAQWIYLKGEFASVSDRVIAQGSSKIEGREHIGFSIRAAQGKKLIMGDYQVKLFLDEVEQVSLPFRIVDAASLPGPYLSEAVAFILGDTDNQTMNLVNSFPASVETINVMVKANNCPNDTEVIFKWIMVQTADGAAVNETLDEKTTKASGTSPLFYSVSRKDKEFPRGRYAVKMLLNGTEIMSVPFQVR